MIRGWKSVSTAEKVRLHKTIMENGVSTESYLWLDLGDPINVRTYNGFPRAITYQNIGPVYEVEWGGYTGKLKENQIEF